MLRSHVAGAAVQVVARCAAEPLPLLIFIRANHHVTVTMTATATVTVTVTAKLDYLTTKIAI